MKRCLTAVVLALFASSVQSETVVVRSGEHGPFTRLVFRLPDSADWTLTQSGDRAFVKVSDPTIDFLTTSVFDRIGRSRLRDVSQATRGDSLELDFACDCGIQGTVENGNLLVLDFGEGISKAPPPVTDDPADFAEMDTPSAVQPIDRVRLPVLPTAENTPSLARLPSALSLPETAALERQRENVSISEERLLSQLSRAASQGLLEPLRNQNQPNRAPKSKPRTDRLPTEPQVKESDRPQVSVSALSTIDLTTLSRIGRVAEIETEVACTDEKELNIEEWGDDRPFHIQIGELRGDLYGEFDRLDVQKVTKLAKTYLFFGFGAEAVQTLSLVPSDAMAPSTVSTMAHILDDQNVKVGPGFRGQEHCDGPAALWAVLSNPADATPSNVNKNAVLRSFWRLPPHLRAHLGSKVSAMFTAQGDDESAAQVFRSINRGDADTGPELKLSEADAAASRGLEDVADVLLEEVSATETETALVAAMKKVDRAFEADETLQPETPELISSFATEFRRSEYGPDLRRSLVRATALVGDYSSALTALDSVDELDGKAALHSAEMDILRLVVARTSDVDFLEIAYPIVTFSPPPKDLILQTDLAQRFLSLNLPDPVEKMLEQRAQGNTETRRRILRANVALLRGKPSRALLELHGESTPDSDQLRAEAHARLRDHEAAATYFARTGSIDNADRETWLSDDWAAVVDRDNLSEYGQTTQRISETRETPNLSDALGPLAHSKALLENAADTRAEIARMLDFTSTTSTNLGTSTSY